HGVRVALEVRQESGTDVGCAHGAQYSRPGGDEEATRRRRGGDEEATRRRREYGRECGRALRPPTVRRAARGRDPRRHRRDTAIAPPDPAASPGWRDPPPPCARRALAPP